MREITIGTETYSVDKMKTMTQVFIGKRILPSSVNLIAVAVGGLGHLLPKEGAPQPTREQIADELRKVDILSLVAPITDAISRMNDADVQMVFVACFECTKRRAASGQGWQAIWNAQANDLQFADIDITASLQIVAAALMENFGPFTSGVLSLLPQPPLPPETQSGG